MSPRPTLRRERSGFTLIELLIVVVIIGILAAVAVPKFSNTKGKAYVTAIKTDLRNLATAEEAYSYEYAVYTDNLASLNYNGSKGVIMSVAVSGNGWSAEATHPDASPLVCQLYFGDAGPLSIATQEGKIACSD